MERVNSFGQPIGRPLPDWQPPPLPQRTSLEGRFCRLDPLDPDLHAAPLHAEFAGHPAGFTYLAYGPFPSLTAYQEWLRSVAVTADPLFFVILDRATLRPLGLASYLRIDPQAGSIEVGHLNFSPAMQRSPLATEAMYLMMRQAFRLGYRRYEWKCDALNGPSRAAAQRLGFSHEGTFHQATVYKGRNRDTAWYAILDSDWPDLQHAFETWLNPDNFDGHGQQRGRLSELTGKILRRRE